MVVHFENFDFIASTSVKKGSKDEGEGGFGVSKNDGLTNDRLTWVTRDTKAGFGTLGRY